MLEALEKMLAAGKESALLRFGIGAEHLKRGDAAAAIPHLERAVALDPAYSAAWKLLGKACEADGRRDAAVDAWRQGIAIAESRGDRQAAKEMTVFLRRLERAPDRD